MCDRKSLDCDHKCNRGKVSVKCVYEEENHYVRLIKINARGRGTRLRDNKVNMKKEISRSQLIKVNIEYEIKRGQGKLE